MKIMVATNELRKDDSSIIKATKAQRLLDAGMTKTEVARQFGLQTHSLRDLLNILDTSDKIQERVDKDISVSAAAELSDLGRKDQESVVRQIEEQGIHVTKAAIKAVKEMRNAAKATSADPSSARASDAEGASTPKGSPLSADQEAESGQGGASEAHQADPVTPHADGVSAAVDKPKSDSKSAGAPTGAIILAPRPATIKRVRDTYTAGVTASAVTMLTWITTGHAADSLPDPRGGKGTLADYLREVIDGNATP